MSDDSYSATDELIAILKSANARVTFDRDRSNAKPCVICSTTTEPRDLVEIGRYTRRMGGNLQPGDAIVRPMCWSCKGLTEDVPVIEPSP